MTLLKVFALCFLSGCSLHQGLPPDPVQQPPQAWRRQCGIYPEVQHGNVTGMVALDTAEKAITLRWRFTRSGRVLRSDQVERVSYWPTASAASADQLLMAGVRPTNGNTVIEKWTLRCPAPPTSGDVYAATYTKELIHDARLDGLGPVRLMRNIQGAAPPGKALVQFGGSNSVHELDVGSHRLTLLWTPASIPALSESRWQFIEAADHEAYGFMYVYTPDLPAAPPSSHLVLYDSDRDASLDGWVLLDASQWAALGEPASWIRVFPH